MAPGAREEGAEPWCKVGIVQAEAVGRSNDSLTSKNDGTELTQTKNVILILYKQWPLTLASLDSGSVLCPTDTLQHFIFTLSVARVTDHYKKVVQAMRLLKNKLWDIKQPYDD